MDFMMQFIEVFSQNVIVYLPMTFRVTDIEEMLFMLSDSPVSADLYAVAAK